MERGWKPNVEISPACPRCGSSNTKFCYYNNYSLTQPRYFCKGCRRYWTKGGSLRNIPVGGGCRKTRRSRPTHIGGASSRNSPYGCALGGGGHINGNSMAETTTSSSSTMAADGSNIDLAAVYANYLNQRPQLPNGHVGPSMEVSGVDDMAMDVEFITHLPQENCVIENLGGLDSIQHYFTSSNNDEMMINNGLPPLPGEETVWSHSEDQHPNLWNYGSFFRP